MHDENPIQDHSEGHPSEHAGVEKHSQAGQRSPGDVISLIEDVERKLETMRAAQSLQVEQYGDLETREREVVESEKALADSEKALAEAQKSVSETEKMVAESRTRMAEEKQGIEADRAALEQVRQEAESSFAEREIEAEKRVGELERSLSEARETRQELEAEREQSSSQLRQAGEKLRELATVIGEQAPRLEQGAAAIARVGVQEQTIASLEDCIASMSQVEQKDDAACQALQNRINELEEALFAAEEHQQAGDALQNRITELEEALSAAGEHQQTGDALQNRITELEEALSAAGEHQQTGDALQNRITELEEALSAAGEHQQTGDALQSRITELEEALSAAGEHQQAGDALQSRIVELEEALSAAEEHAPLGDAGDESLRNRITELEQALAMVQDNEQVEQFAEKLRARAEHVSELATGLEQRRRRLQGMHVALKERKRSSVQSSVTVQSPEPASASADLERARACLAESEQQMMRKWGRNWAFAGVAWFAVLVFVVGIGSWFAVARFMALPGTATVDMVASTPSGRPLQESALEGWSTWHTALPTDPAFAETIYKRLAMRGLAPAGGETAVANLLAHDLTFDSDGPGKLRLVLSGEDRRTLLDTLDVIATTMAGESSRQAPRREQSARASIVGERNAVGRTMYASLAPMNLDGAFFTRYGLVAGIGLGMALGMVWLVYGVLRRGKRVFEESEDGVEFGESL